MWKNIATGVLVSLIVGILSYAATILVKIETEYSKAAIRDSLIYYNINNVRSSVNDVVVKLDSNNVVNTKWHEKFLTEKKCDLSFTRKHLLKIELKLNMIKDIQDFASYRSIRGIDDTLLNLNDSCLVDVCE